MRTSTFQYCHSHFVLNITTGVYCFLHARDIHAGDSELPYIMVHWQCLELGMRRLFCIASSLHLSESPPFTVIGWYVWCRGRWCNALLRQPVSNGGTAPLEPPWSWSKSWSLLPLLFSNLPLIEDIHVCSNMPVKASVAISPATTIHSLNHWRDCWCYCIILGVKKLLLLPNSFKLSIPL